MSEGYSALRGLQNVRRITNQINIEEVPKTGKRFPENI